MQLKLKPQGFALTEALVALLILAFGVLGLLWMHQQALISQRQQLMRSVAAGLAQDWVERMRLNAPLRANYAKSWGSSTLPGTDCAATPCLRSELAVWDLAQLQHSLQSQLPEGDATVFTLTTSPDLWGIVIAWRDASETYTTNATAGSPACPSQMSCWRLFFRPDR